MKYYTKFAKLTPVWVLIQINFDPTQKIGPKKGVGALLIVVALIMQIFFSQRKPKFCMSRSIECQCNTT